jgi:hypothetical protein
LTIEGKDAIRSHTSSALLLVKAVQKEDLDAERCNAIFASGSS